MRVLVILYLMLCAGLASARDPATYLIYCERSGGLVSSYIQYGESYTNNCRAAGMPIISHFDNTAQNADEFRWINCQLEQFPALPSLSWIQVQGKNDLITYTFNCGVAAEPNLAKADLWSLLLMLGMAGMFGFGWLAGAKT